VKWPKDWMDEQIKKASMAEAMRLEEQAQIFIKMGFAVDELTCVQRGYWPTEPGYERGVYPKSMVCGESS
jgi:hypothetical protein